MVADALHPFERNHVGGGGGAAVPLHARFIQLGGQLVPHPLAVTARNAAQCFRPPRLKRQIQKAIRLEPVALEQPRLPRIRLAGFVVHPFQRLVPFLGHVIGNRNLLQRCQPIPPMHGEPIPRALGFVADGGGVALPPKENIERGEAGNGRPARAGDRFGCGLEGGGEERGRFPPHHGVNIQLVVRVGVHLHQRDVGQVFEAIADLHKAFGEGVGVIGHGRFLRPQNRLYQRRKEIHHLDGCRLEAAFVLVAHHRDGQAQIFHHKGLV